MDIKRILWPTDYSDNAAKALPYVVSLAEKYDAEILALHVVEPVTRMGALADLLATEEVQKLHERAKEHSNQKLFDTCGEHMTTCRVMDKRIVVGDVADEILKASENENVDMIILASHGYSGFRRFAFGSVAEKVMSGSKVPVLTVKID